MLQFELSLHATEQIKLREISEAIIFDVVNNPEKILEDGQGQHIYQKIVLFENNSVYLVRVFVNSSKNLT